MTAQKTAQIKSCYWNIVANGELERVRVRARIAYYLTHNYGWDQGAAQKTMAECYQFQFDGIDLGDNLNVCLCDGDENGKCICPYTNEFAPSDKAA